MSVCLSVQHVLSWKQLTVMSKT